MGGTMQSASKRLLATVRNKLDAAVLVSAHRVLGRADEYVPRIGTAPYATDALRASGHVLAGSEDGYSSAVNRAVAARDRAIASGVADSRTKPLKGSEIAPNAIFEPREGESVAIVVYPLTYAELIHDGYSLGSNGYMAARPFLADAAIDEENNFKDEVLEAMAKAEDVSYVGAPIVRVK